MLSAKSFTHSAQYALNFVINNLNSVQVSAYLMRIKKNSNL